MRAVVCIAIVRIAIVRVALAEWVCGAALLSLAELVWRSTMAPTVPSDGQTDRQTDRDRQTEKR